MTDQDQPGVDTDTDVRALVKRLREAAKEIAAEGHNGWGNTCTWAADTIERLLAERDATVQDVGNAYLQGIKQGHRERDAQVREARIDGYRNGWHDAGFVSDPLMVACDIPLTKYLATRERPSTQEAGK